MKCSKFEDLPCRQKARELCKAVFEMINRGPFAKDFGLKPEEPGALIALVRVCGGSGRVTSQFYPEGRMSDVRCQ